MMGSIVMVSVISNTKTKFWLLNRTSKRLKSILY